MDWIKGWIVSTAGVAALALVMAGCGAEDQAPTGAAGEQGAATVAAEDGLAQDVISVEGMTCSVCVSGVRRQLTGVDGVASADVSLADRQAQVRYDPAKVSGVELAERLDAGSFTARLVKPDEDEAAEQAED